MYKPVHPRMAETLRHGRRQRTGAKRVDLRRREAQEYLGYNNSDNEENRVLAADVVFLVDNSGSMGEEANAIARDIIDWVEKLAASSLDVRFGCVGYDGGINGALNITTVEDLNEYLSRYSGTSRTSYFGGDDASTLSSASYSYRTGGECGMAALRFADKQFSFRTGANRIYVNFTDEPNQPGGQSAFSVFYLNDQKNRNTMKGTVHTMYSERDTTYTERTNYTEKSWRMSRFTGGTEIYTSSCSTGVTLDQLPATGAIQNSYVIRFTNIKEFMDGHPHLVTITILSADGHVQAERTFSVIFERRKLNHSAPCRFRGMVTNAEPTDGCNHPPVLHSPHTMCSRQTAPSRANRR